MSRLAMVLSGAILTLTGCVSNTHEATRHILLPQERAARPEIIWKEAQARVLPDGDLRWTPQPFTLRVGKIVRFIDFQDGSDLNDGTSREHAWKHHPWDAAATARAAAGVDGDTYVFKRGCTYQGNLVAAGSGSETTPVRLTSDPSWGSGEAILRTPEPGAGMQTVSTIIIRDRSHISISGLTFRFPKAGAAPSGADQNLAGIRIIGGCRDIRVSNCLFQQLPAALCATSAGKLLDSISFTDNRVEFADREAVRVSADSGSLRGVQVLRNSIHDVGNRPAEGQEGHCISLVRAAFPEVAGNMLARTTGIWVVGRDGSTAITRALVHHNKVIDSLWAVPGASGIQTSGTGPFYIYNNIVSPHDSAYAVTESCRTYVFNNIGFSGRKDATETSATIPAIAQDVVRHNVFANNSFNAPMDPLPVWVKMFVPWALCDPVGEWNFYRNAADPNRVRDDSAPPASSADERAPGRTDLRGNAFRYGDYVNGMLEDWTAGALQLDGISQYLTLPAAAIEPVQRPPTQPADPRSLDLSTGSFIIEAYLRADPQHLGGAIVSKMRDSGFELKVADDGSISLTLRSPYEISTVEQATVLKDGKWHHILVEVDRAASTATFFIDGHFVSAGVGLLKDPIGNRAELWVGRNTEGLYFAGDIDFLRICRGTFADAATSIDELYAWEFDGPQLRSFTGHKLP